MLGAQPASEGLRLASLLGYAGFFFLAATVVLGMATALDAWGSRISGAALEQLHLTCAVAGLAGVGGHITAHVVRDRGGVDVWEAFIPFAAGGWIVAAGVVGWLGIVVVAAAVPWRQRLGYRTWLRIHQAAYGAAALTALHVIAASDEVAGFTLSGILVIVACVSVLLAGRRRARGSGDFHPGPGPAPHVVELDP